MLVLKHTRFVYFLISLIFFNCIFKYLFEKITLRHSYKSFKIKSNYFSIVIFQTYSYDKSIGEWQRKIKQE